MRKNLKNIRPILLVDNYYSFNLSSLIRMSRLSFLLSEILCLLINSIYIKNCLLFNINMTDIIRELGLSEILPKIVMWGVLGFSSDVINRPVLIRHGEAISITKGDRLVIYNNGEIIFNELITAMPNCRHWRDDKSLYTPFLDKEQLKTYQDAIHASLRACIIRFN